jgi:hypothetical protein
VFRHHHAYEKPMTETERATLLSEGAVIQGMVMRNEPSAADPRISQVRIYVRFSGDQMVEFSEELANLYQPAPGSPEARRLAEVRQAQQLRHADRIPKIQLPLSDGERVPVRYDAADRSRIVLDVPALRKRALHDYIQREQRPKAQPPARTAPRTGPPWTVPTHWPELRCAGRPGQGLA